MYSGEQYCNHNKPRLKLACYSNDYCFFCSLTFERPALCLDQLSKNSVVKVSKIVHFVKHFRDCLSVLQVAWLAFAAISGAGGLRTVHRVEDHHRGGRHLQSKFSHALLAPFFMRTKVLRGKLLRSYSNDNCVGRIFSFLRQRCSPTVLFYSSPSLFFYYLFFRKPKVGVRFGWTLRQKVI